MKYLLVTFLILTCITCAKREPLKIDIKKEIYAPEHYVVAKTDKPLTIDGKASEVTWQNAPFSELFIDIEGTVKPKYATQVKMLWDSQYLYVFANLEEPHIWGNLKQRDTIIFYNNDFEVFLDPSGTTFNYGEIEVNALNTVWDLMLDKPYRVGGNADNNWNLDGLKTAISIRGTLNDPTDVDSSWSVEMAIPLEPILQLKGANQNHPFAGEQWRVNFSRVNWDHDIINGMYSRKRENGKYLPEYNWVWSKQKVINMHEPEKWGFIQFSDSTTPDNSEFKPEEDLDLKLACYALFRHTRFGSLKDLLSEKEGFFQIIQTAISNEKSIDAIFTKTSNGFTIKVLQPAKNKVYIINQEGWLEIK